MCCAVVSIIASKLCTRLYAYRHSYRHVESTTSYSRANGYDPLAFERDRTGRQSHSFWSVNTEQPQAILQGGGIRTDEQQSIRLVLSTNNLILLIKAVKNLSQLMQVGTN